MLGQRLDLIQHARMQRAGLEREPLVNHQGIAGKALIESRQLGLAQRGLQPRQHQRRALAVGHVVSGVKLGRGQLSRECGRPGRQIDQRLRLHFAGAARLGREAVRDSAGAGMEGNQRILQLAPQPGLQPFAFGPDCAGIGTLKLFGQVSLARQGHQLAAHQVIQRRVSDHRCQRPPDGFAPGLAFGIAQHATANRCNQMLDHQLLQGFVTRKRIIIVGGQEQQVCRRAIDIDIHRRGEATVEREDRLLRETGEA